MTMDVSSLPQPQPQPTPLQSANHEDGYPLKITSTAAIKPNSTASTDDALDSLSPLAPTSTSKHSSPAALPLGKENQFSRNSIKPTSSNPGRSSGLDPLSTQIYLRTNSNTEPSIAQRLLGAARPDSPPNPDSINRPNNDSIHGLYSDSLRERKKGVSFLSRFHLRGSFKKEDAGNDSDSEFGDAFRTDGTNAIAPTTIVGACGGYHPLHKVPPRYIRVKSHHRKSRVLNRLFLAQELSTEKEHDDGESLKHAPATVVGSKILKGGDAIWAAEFSLDGHYLAAAGMDHIVRIYAVLSTPQERKAYEEEHDEGDAKESRAKRERLSAPVFHSKPIREFQGHAGEVLALSWSKNNFLLSSSMDKTVQLWHLSRQESLCTFNHPDLVTSIAFHPLDDRFFIAGSLDEQLRLWSIPDKSVAFSATTGGFVTAVAFTPDGKTAICGLLSGLCIFYETQGLSNPWQIHVRSSRGKNAKGSKITGIHTAPIFTPDSPQGDVKVLISSNDSRVRIYNLKTRMLEAKFKGHENLSSQIHARFSDDGHYVLSGSEDRKAYIWDISHPDIDLRDKQPYESFDAHPEVVTVALMAPTAAKQLLSASGDPIYDLCNPPPVTLTSLSESTVSQSALSDGAHSDVPASVKKRNESPAYIERSKHKTGNIIITTDRKGVIKVFRQDCAALKRRQSLWETGSRLSTKLNGLGRSPSLATNGSRAHSRSGSLSITGNIPFKGQGALDQILSWQQDIEGGRNSIGAHTNRSDRSISPSKSGIPTPHNISASHLAFEARKQPYIAALHSGKKGSSIIAETGASNAAYTDSAQLPPAKHPQEKETGISPTIPPTPSFSFISASDADGQDDARDGKFWNLSRWRGGISGLRNVAANALPGDKDKGDKGNNANHSRKASASADRRSIGPYDFRRLINNGDETSLRRCAQPIVPKLSPPNHVEAEALPPAASHDDSSADSSKPVAARRPKKSLVKKRADSGVGQLSGSSSEANE